MPDKETWEKIRKSAKEQTDAEFASQISSLTRLKDEEITAIAPEPQDRKKLAELLKVVKDAAKDNSEKADAIKNVNGFAEIAVSLLSKLL